MSDAAHTTKLPDPPQWRTLADVEQAARDFLADLFRFAPAHRDAVWIAGVATCPGCGQVWPCPVGQASMLRDGGLPLRECGSLEWHEPHEVDLADGEQAVCPGVEVAAS